MMHTPTGIPIRPIRGAAARVMASEFQKSRAQWREAVALFVMIVFFGALVLWGG